MSEELRPCPLCGGEAEEFTGEDAAPHRWTVECDSCGAHVGSDTRHKARAKWNRRAGGACEQRRTRRTCRMVDCDSHDTCVVNSELGNGDVMSMEFGYKQCSECGAYVFDCPTVRYCPSCGAKVVDEL